MAFPLSVVIFISMCKDAYEDRKRHKEDHAENEREVEVYEAGKFVKKHWK